MLTSTPRSQTQHPKKRRRRPRATLACQFCRKRKTRCSGEYPSCLLCTEHDIQCRYEPIAGSRPRHQEPSEQHGAEVSLPEPPPTSASAYLEQISASQEHSHEQSRSTSVEPGDVTFDNGLHIGPTSGVSFLYRRPGSSVQHTRGVETPAVLSTYGDVPLPRFARADFPDMREAAELLDHYFCFATPTFRFFHRQTLEESTKRLLDGEVIRAAEAACVLTLWAQALLYREATSGSESVAYQRSVSYFEQARNLLDNEPGPPQIASVEARLAACLYLLSTSRVHTCRFLFAFTHTIVITLALHRKTTKHQELRPLMSERRRRAFWSFYIIDGYLSVLLGQPRQMRDEDVDQPYPNNIEDHVLHTAVDLSKVPHHGNLEALINHAKLARILAHTNDLLYPITPIPKEEIVARAEAMIAALDELEQQLPPFLQSRVDASLGSQTWDRQNSVLGLAIAHARIIATRRTILLNSSPGACVDESMPGRHEACVRLCLGAICNMLDHVYPMVLHRKLRRGFWLTQYVTMCAVSTLFVYKLQRSRGRMHFASDMVLDKYFSRANQVQEYMASIATAGSTAKRHHTLFARLKQQAKDNDQAGVPGQYQAPSSQQEAADADVTESSGRLLETNGGDQSLLMDATSNAFDEFTPGGMFDISVADASSWQYLDQLLPDGFDLSLQT